MRKLGQLSLLLLAVLLANTSFSQGFPWLIDIEGGGTFSEPFPTDVEYDSTGHIYVTGAFNTVASIAGTSVTGTAYDGFLAKFTTNGTLVWVETFGGSGDDAGAEVVLDHSGGVYVSGVYASTATFDTITSTATVSSGVENFLAKYDTNGNIQWLKKGSRSSFATFSGLNYIPSQLQYSNGSIYYAAQYNVSGFNPNVVNYTFDGNVLPVGNSTSSSSNVLWASYQTNGTLNWIDGVTVGGSFFATSTIHDLRLDGQDNCYLLTLGRDTVKFDGVSIPPPGASAFDYYNVVIKANSSGQYQGNHTLANQGFITGFQQAMEVTSQGEVYVAAYRSNTNPQTLLGQALPQTGSFIYKLNTSLAPTNVSIISNASGFTGNTFVGAIELLPNNKLFIGGSVDGLVTVGNLSLLAQREIFFSQIDTGLTTSDYLIRTDRGQSGSIIFSDYPTIKNTSLGTDGLYMVGNVEFSNTSFGNRQTSSSFNQAGFVTKLIECAPIQSTISPDTAIVCGSTGVGLAISTDPSFGKQWLFNGSPISGAIGDTYNSSNSGSYSVEIDSLGCVDTSDIALIIQEPLPTVTVPTSSLSICNTAAPFVLTGGSPAGGIWSGTGVVNDTMFDPSLVGNGPVLLTYTYTSPSGCSNSAVRIANVVSPPTLLVTGTTPNLCEGDQPISLGGIVSPFGGSYSGPGVTNNQFDPAAGGVGTHVITYTFSQTVGCSSSITFNAVVNPSPQVNLPAFGPVCNTTFSMPLTTGTPAGGSYSGNFVISNSFFPFLSGPGTFPITYTVTQNGCTSSVTENIQVDAPPTAGLSAIGPFCIDDNVQTLSNGSPAGGTYLLNGTPTTTLDPSALGTGSHTLEYTVSNSCGPDTASITVVVNSLPTVTIPSFGPYCENDGSVTLSGATPSGGDYTINGTLTTSIVPSQLQLGANQLIYSYTDGNGCSASDTTTVTINAKPTASLVLVDSLCINNGVYNLTGLPIGGVFSGSGVVGSTFDPSLAGVGIHPIQYIATNSNNCSDTVVDSIRVLAPVSPTLANFTPVCQDAAAFMLTGGFPSGGTYSGVGVTNGMFDPSISGSGTFDIVYTITTVCGSRSDTSQLTVNPLPIVSLPAIAAVCEGSSNFTLPAGTPAGGSYSGTGVIGNVFSPSTSGVGTFNVAYTFIDGNGCIGSDTQQVVVNPLPTVNLSNFTDVCIDAGFVTLSGGSPAGGTYSGTGVSGGQFDPLTAGVGTHTITYTYTDGNGCTDNAQATITVNDLPTVTWSALADVCVDASAITLSGGMPMGGTYSGTGVTNGVFDPAVAGVGTFTLTYSYTDANSCTNSTTETITVDPLPVVTLAAFNPVCIDAGTITLSGGMPMGGTYSGTGVSAGQFDPAVAGVGSHVITYSYTDGNGCSDSDTASIVVNPLPIVSLSGLSDVCISASAFALSGGMPMGGTYSGTGVSGGQFDPAVAGVGQHIITYSYTDGNSCTSTDTDTIEVNPLPTVTLAPLADVCVNGGLVTLSGGTPAGGTYSGTGVSAGQFDPAAAGVGSHVITYAYTDANGCSNSANASIQVDTVPVVDLQPFTALCVDAGAINLSGGMPMGGTYSGTGVSGGQFDPAVAGVGSHVITYSYTDGNGCSDSDTTSIVVNPLPTVSFTGLSDVCIDAGAITLSGGMPMGGTYSGTGVSAGQFDPVVAGVGQHIISYSYTDGNGCTNSDVDTIEVNPLPTVTLAPLADICLNAGAITLTGGSPAGGTYSGFGVSSGQFDPAAAGAGPHLITYTYTDGNGCTDFDTATILVTGPQLTTLSVMPEEVCESGSPVTLSGGIPFGGVYSGTGVSAGQFDPVVAGVGQHIITYEHTNSFGCVGTATDTIEVVADPTVTLTGLPDVCVQGGTLALSGGTPAGGVYSGTGVSGGIFDPALAGVGNHIITYTFTTTLGCIGFDTDTIEVFGTPTVSLAPFMDVCEGATPFALGGGTPLGGSYSGIAVSGGSFDPAAAGVGTHVITYTYTDLNGCTGTASEQIMVNPTPTVVLDLDTALCLNSTPFNLSGGTPTGGVYSGSGVANGVFDPTALAAGIYTIRYEFSDANGCIGIDSGRIELLALPQVDAGTDQSICSGETATLTATGADVYTWSTTDQTASITVAPVVNTTYGVVGTDTISGCQAGDSVIVTVNPLPQVNLPDVDTICSDSILTLDAGDGFATYTWSTGDLTQEITAGPFGDGNQEVIWVAVTDANGCAGSDTLSFYADKCDPDNVADFGSDDVLLRAYPNPNQGNFTIEASKWNGELNVQLISSTGALVYQRSYDVGNAWSQQVDVSWLSNGMYSLLISNSEKVYRKQIMINR